MKFTLPCQTELTSKIIKRKCLTNLKQTITDLTKHIGNVHDGKKSHKCEICFKSYMFRNHLKKHVEAIHRKKKAF